MVVLPVKFLPDGRIRLSYPLPEIIKNGFRIFFERGTHLIWHSLGPYIVEIKIFSSRTYPRAPITAH